MKTETTYIIEPSTYGLYRWHVVVKQVEGPPVVYDAIVANGFDVVDGWVVFTNDGNVAAFPRKRVVSVQRQERYTTDA